MANKPKIKKNNTYVEVTQQPVMKVSNAYIAVTKYMKISGTYSNITTGTVSSGVIPTVTSSPIITSAVAGSTIQFTNAVFSGTPTPTVATEYYVNGTSVGSTNPTLSTVGSTVIVKQTATNSKGSVVATSNSYTVTGVTQNLTPFTLGTIDFAVASLDAYAYDNNHISHGGDLYREVNPSATVVKDAIAGYAIQAWSDTILPTILARSATANLVVVLASPLGNDTTNSINDYGSPSGMSDPTAFWNAKLAILASGVAQLKAAGFKVIVGNNTYRRYNLDSSRRTNEDLGSEYVNKNFLEPWIKTNMPECWNTNADRPMLDVYRFTWNLGDWIFKTDDQVHLTDLGYAHLRRYVAKVVTTMSLGNVPSAITKIPYASLGVANGITGTAINEHIWCTGATAAQTSLPTGINKAYITAAATNAKLYIPSQVVDVTGANSSVTLTGHGWYASASSGRGNTGDTSVSLTNNTLLTNCIYLTTTGGRTQGFIEIGGLTPNGKYTIKYQASASVSATVGDKVSDVYVYGQTQQHIADEALPTGYLTFNTVADGVGYVHMLVTLASGATAGYLSGVSISNA